MSALPATGINEMTDPDENVVEFWTFDVTRDAVVA
jgi:hypothetical protein